MKHSSREVDGVVVLILEGKIMGEPGDTLLVNMVAKFVEQGKLNVVMDFSNVVWINSVGLGLCITVLTSLRNRGGDLRLACVQEKVRSFLDKSRMFAVFESFSTVEDAAAGFRK